MRNLARSEGVGWGGRIAIGAGALLILAAIGLAIYSGTVHPVQHAVEQVIPNDRFSR
ncbi:MAG: hypothetical protein WCA81_05985 [Rhizomicrobium sp.]